jgi:hypothetical protein
LAAELAELDARLLAIDGAIRDATNRRRYGGTPDGVARAADDLDRLVADLDRLMTRKRAVEAKLLLIGKMAASANAQREETPGEWPGRLAVEIWRGQGERGTG